MNTVSKNPGRPSMEEARIDELFQQEIGQHRNVVDATARGVRADFGTALRIMAHSLEQGGKLLFFGNGGSAAQAQHIAAELVVRYKLDRAPIAAIALTADSSTLTACANDLGFEALFARQIAALGRPGDVAVDLSTSGRSPNILEGLRRARADGLKTVGLTGASAGEIAALCDAAIAVPSAITARVQEMHVMIGHLLCLALESHLGRV